MRNCMIWCVVLLGIAGTAYSEAPKPAEQGKAKKEVDADSKAKGPPKELTVDLGGGAKMKMVLIPAGEFMMGNSHTVEEEVALFKKYDMFKTFGQEPRTDNWWQEEYPRHRVRITKPFYLGKYEVTVGQFRKFVNDTRYETDADKRGAEVVSPANRPEVLGFNDLASWEETGFEQTDEHPVINVSWNDAVAFCRWLSRKEGKTYRLPTEAEWEYACRAGTTTRYCSGDDPETLAGVGNAGDATARAKFPKWTQTIKARDGYVFTAPVGKFRPNTWGLYDMHGNASEWCADWYDADYYEKSPTDDPAGKNLDSDPPRKSLRVLRGGSWVDPPWACRSAERQADGPSSPNNSTGFRVSRLVADKSGE